MMRTHWRRQNYEPSKQINPTPTNKCTLRAAFALPLHSISIKFCLFWLDFFVSLHHLCVALLFVPPSPPLPQILVHKHYRWIRKQPYQFIRYYCLYTKHANTAHVYSIYGVYACGYYGPPALYIDGYVLVSFSRFNGV